MQSVGPPLHISNLHEAVYLYLIITYEIYKGASNKIQMN